MILKDDDGRRNRRLNLQAREKQRERVAKLFELDCHLPHVAFSGVADEQEILDADARPSLLSQRGRRDDEEERENNYWNKEFSFHWVSPA